MTLAPSCPRCPSPVRDEGDGWRCADHGPITPLWRPAAAEYHAFAEHLKRSHGIPSLMPWPLAPGWHISDFGAVASEQHDPRAGFVSVSGPTEADGFVELTVVSEEPGVGLGARIAGAPRTDPGADIGDGPPHAKVRVDGRPVPLWVVSTSASDATFDRSVFAGEARGCWLWMIMRPASAALLLQDEWVLHDVAGLGPALIDLPFGGSPLAW